MSRPNWAALALGCLSLGAGCGVSERAELEKVKAELAATQAQVKAMQALSAEKKAGYLDELERLEVLRDKGVLTGEEFVAKKKAILQASPAPAPPQPLSSMDELARQLRSLHALYMNSTITNIEKDQKKGQLLKGPLVLADLRKDLETVHQLYNESVITNIDRDALKKRLLDPGK